MELELSGGKHDESALAVEGERFILWGHDHGENQPKGESEDSVPIEKTQPELPSVGSSAPGPICGLGRHRSRLRPTPIYADPRGCGGSDGPCRWPPLTGRECELKREIAKKLFLRSSGTRSKGTTSSVRVAALESQLIRTRMESMRGGPPPFAPPMMDARPIQNTGSLRKPSPPRHPIADVLDRRAQRQSHSNTRSRIGCGIREGSIRYGSRPAERRAFCAVPSLAGGRGYHPRRSRPVSA